MKLAYFDCQFGAAGDMLNAALLAAGADQQKWQQELAKLGLPEGSYKATVREVMRCGVACKKLDVVDASGQLFDQEPSSPSAFSPQTDEATAPAGFSPQSGGAHDHADAHEHHEHEHHHEHHHEHDHEHAHHQPSHAHRGLTEILQLIERSSITQPAKDLASRIFKRLARAEARVHGVPADEVQFHEVGAIDAIVDIVGFSIAYHLLGIERSVGSAVAIGSGKTRSEHGLIPVPGPATVYLLQEAGAAIAKSRIDFECLTPTGAAILCEVVQEWGVQPPFTRLTAAGYGAGTKNPHDWPNACRVMLGETSTTSGAEPRFGSDSVIVLEANLDDINPQVLAFATERLFEAGALDVSLVPAMMKKGRAGHLLTVVCQPSSRSTLEEIILTQTTTIGVRAYESRRAVAQRRWEDVKMERGDVVRIKLAMDNQGQIINMQPEYDECAAYAAKYNLPLKDVTNQALARYLKQSGGQENRSQQ